MTSVDSCRTREIKGVGAVELVCVGGLLKMSGKSLLLLCGGLLEVESLVKGSWKFWVVRAVL